MKEQVTRTRCDACKRVMDELDANWGGPSALCLGTAEVRGVRLTLFVQAKLAKDTAEDCDVCDSCLDELMREARDR